MHTVSECLARLLYFRESKHPLWLHLTGLDTGLSVAGPCATLRYKVPRRGHFLDYAPDALSYLSDYCRIHTIELRVQMESKRSVVVTVGLCTSEQQSMCELPLLRGTLASLCHVSFRLEGTQYYWIGIPLHADRVCTLWLGESHQSWEQIKNALRQGLGVTSRLGGWHCEAQGRVVTVRLSPLLDMPGMN